jgi:uncharacterized protein YebE (UPF0316 family)
MHILGLTSDQVYAWILLPALIFLARAADVTVGTLRIVLMSRGRKFLAPILGFFELMIWLLAIGQVFKNLDNSPLLYYVAYAAGFSAGNLVGLVLEEKLAMGLEVLRVITRRRAIELVNELRDQGYGVTEVPGRGATGPVSILFMLVRRKSLESVLDIVLRHHPKAFYSVEDVRKVAEGVFPLTARTMLPFRMRSVKHK